MKQILFILALLVSGTAFAACDNIQDNDMKAECQATVYNNRAYCDHIRNSDRQAYCSAKLTHNPALCDRIQVSDLRAECRTFVK
ncbi:MAG: hypothetical protein II942_03500 [Alphaproteobacteria bacterium]|nr:hypothetical protein [Alphaproteobacteria bacterium]